MFIDIHTHLEQFKTVEIPGILNSAIENKVDLIDFALLVFGVWTAQK